MARKPDFFSQMDASELEKLEAFAREPGATVDKVHEWMLANGYTASRSAVGRWFKRFREDDRFRATADMADAMFTAVKETGGGLSIPDAAILKISQIVFDNAAALDPETASTKDIANLSLALQRLTLGKQRVEEVRNSLAERFDSETRKLVNQKREITQDDITEVRKAVFG